jgi:hypothetical protein
MRVVVADTSPIFYLLSIDHIGLLPRLFEKIWVPDAVYQELCHPAAPPVVRDWVARHPAWAEVTKVEAIDDPTLRTLGAGERGAITLALALRADLVLIDERKGTAGAQQGIRCHRDAWRSHVGRAARFGRSCGFLRSTQAYEFPLSSGDNGRIAQSTGGRVGLRQAQFREFRPVGS